MVVMVVIVVMVVLVVMVVMVVLVVMVWSGLVWSGLVCRILTGNQCYISYSSQRINLSTCTLIWLRGRVISL